MARDGEEGGEPSACLVRDFVDSGSSWPRVPCLFGQGAVPSADVEAPDAFAVPVHSRAEAAQCLGEREDPVEIFALCVDEGEVVVHVAVRVANEGASRGRAKGGGGPLIEYDGAFALNGGRGL